MPVPQGMLARMISLVREPFITDFRSFATCYEPLDSWVVDPVRASAGLRGLCGARWAQERLQAAAAISLGGMQRSLTARIKQLKSAMRANPYASICSKLNLRIARLVHPERR